uniref:Uncharacterized protein n=1 Tax=Timema bartmani TaxID=61472 RepID=A0A7R9EY22_9NEOP|nr:unnamed protein product [Timema bartmani]
MSWVSNHVLETLDQWHGAHWPAAAGWLCGMLLKLLFSLVVLAALSLGALSYLDQPKFLYVLEVSNTTLTTSLEQLRVTYIELAAHPTTLKLVDNMHTLWKSLCYNAYHLYSTVSQQVPIYLETVKKKALLQLGFWHHQQHRVVLTMHPQYTLHSQTGRLRWGGGMSLGGLVASLNSVHVYDNDKPGGAVGTTRKRERRVNATERCYAAVTERAVSKQKQPILQQIQQKQTRKMSLMFISSLTGQDVTKMRSTITKNIKPTKDKAAAVIKLLYGRPRKKRPLVIMFDIPSDTTVEELRDTTYEQNLSDEVLGSRSFADSSSVSVKDYIMVTRCHKCRDLIHISSRCAKENPSVSPVGTGGKTSVTDRMPVNELIKC